MRIFSSKKFCCSFFFQNIFLFLGRNSTGGWRFIMLGNQRTEKPKPLALKTTTKIWELQFQWWTLQPQIQELLPKVSQHLYIFKFLYNFCVCIWMWTLAKENQSWKFLQRARRMTHISWEFENILLQKARSKQIFKYFEFH